MQQVTSQLMEIMGIVMPYMPYVAYAGIAAVVGGIIAWVLWLVSGWCTWLLRLTGRLAIVLGAFFLICQAMAFMLGMSSATLLISQSGFDRTVVPFWVVGFAFLIPGIIFRLFGALRPTH